MTNYIIGAGASASIIQKHIQDTFIIAPGYPREKPVLELWSTPLSRKYNPDAKEKEITLEILGNEKDLYNQLTHKPSYSKPSENCKSFKALEVTFPEPKISLKESVTSLSKESIKTINKTININEQDNIFICSPITFNIFNSHPSEYVQYFPIYSYEIMSHSLIVQLYDYIYTLTKEYLDAGIYRISNKGNNRYIVESTKEIVNFLRFFPSIFLSKTIHPYANFEVKKQIDFPENFYPTSRASTLYHDYLLTDIYQTLEELPLHKVIK